MSVKKPTCGFKESEAVMKIVVMTSPKLIAPILRRIFGVRKKI